MLVVSCLYPDAQGRVDGIFVHEQVKGLRHRGLDARVVSGQPLWMVRPRAFLRHLGALVDPRWPEWDEYDSVPIVRFLYPADGFELGVQPLLYALALRRKLRALAAAFPFDIVHAHTAFVDGRAGMAAARSRGVPFVLTEHTGPFSSVTADWRRRVHVRAAIRSADRVIAVSEALRTAMVDQLALEGKEGIAVIPNAVDSRFFDPALERSDRGPSGKVGPARPGRALWVGHFVEIKRVDRLLEAFAIASRREPGLRLKLLGSGPLAGPMEQRARTLGIRERVDFSPATGRAGVRKAMSEADFLVISSDTETFGVVAIEALAMGIPVLTTACGGPEEIIDSPRLGQVMGNSAEDLAVGLCRMCADLGSYDAGAIRRAAVDGFDLDRVAERIEALYESTWQRAARRLSGQRSQA